MKGRDGIEDYLTLNRETTLNDPGVFNVITRVLKNGNGRQKVRSE